MGKISELLPPLPKPARFDYDHGADMGTPVYSEAQMRKYALDTIRRAEARQEPLPAGTVTEEWLRDTAMNVMLEAAFAARPAAEPVGVKVCGVAEIDALASEIRRVDGDNALGAGALAEALMPFILSALVSTAPAPGLVEALLPFAKIADDYDDAEDDEFQVWQDFDVLGARLPLKHFRAARAALSTITETGGAK